MTWSRWFSRTVVVGLLAGSPALAHPARVLVLSSGDAALDAQVTSVLQAQGHFPTLGPAYTLFTDQGHVLAGFDVVYLQANANWQAGDMPEVGQTALVDFVQHGGGLLTSEWVLWKFAWRGDFDAIQSLFAAEPSLDFSEATATNFRLVTADPIVSGGLPATFRILLTNYTGTESRLVPRQGAVEFFSTDTFPGAAGVVGIARGQGRVMNISVCAGPATLNSANFQRLMGNCVNWLHPSANVCLADFNGDGYVTSQDFFDFMGEFFVQSARADVNHDSVVNTQDFFDYLGGFFVGCQ